MSNREWVAIDLDGVLAEGRYDPDHPEKIGPLSHSAHMLVAMLVGEGYKLVLFTGRINETETNSDEVVKLVHDWLVANGIDQYIARIWPHPKPSVFAFVDDRACRWRGDPEMTALDVRHATRWCDGQANRTD